MTTCLLLAAGSSSRMGKPKMLLTYKGKTFLQRIIDEVRLVKLPVLVVTGFYHSLLKSTLQQQHISIVENISWQKGMGNSVSAGLRFLMQHNAAADSVLILTCDQPFVNHTIIQQLIGARETSGKGIAVCGYGGTIGIPVLFDKKYFDQLLLLNGDEGAKKIVKQSMEDTVVVDFPAGAVDIDNPEDYEKLLEQLK